MNYATLRLKCGEEHWNLPISGGDCPHHSYFMAAGNMKQPELRSGWATRWNNQYCKPTRAHNPTVVDRTWQTQVFWTTSQPHDVPGSTKLRDPVNPMAVGLFHVFSPCVWDEIKQTINRIKKQGSTRCAASKFGQQIEMWWDVSQNCSLSKSTELA